MPDYENMYYTLLKSVADAVDMLNDSMVKAEDILLESGQQEDELLKAKKLNKNNVRRVYARRKE